jgi:hypothetical protein
MNCGRIIFRIEDYCRRAGELREVGSAAIIFQGVAAQPNFCDIGKLIADGRNVDPVLLKDFFDQDAVVACRTAECPPECMCASRRGFAVTVPNARDFRHADVFRNYCKIEIAAVDVSDMRRSATPDASGRRRASPAARMVDEMPRQPLCRSRARSLQSRATGVPYREV